MSEMIERVARGIFASQEWPEFHPAYEASSEIFETAARAAIEAMRLPTDAMKVNGGLKMEAMLFENDEEYSPVIFETVGVCFRVMIDAALQKEEGE